jgi:hypothetical protein
VEEVGRLGVFEATLSALGNGGTQSTCYDDLDKQVSKVLWNAIGESSPSQ